MTRSQDPFFGVGGSQPAPGRNSLPDGSFEVAKFGGRALAEHELRKHPEIRKNFRSTLRDIVGPEFTAQEFDQLEDRALDAVTPWDLNTLRGIVVGPPVDVNKAQKSVIDQLMQGLGDDALGQRGREAYGEAWRRGKLRVR